MTRKLLLNLALIPLLILLQSVESLAQTNIAPQATVSAFGANQAPFQWNQINDLNFGVCGTQQAFVWTAGPPDGTEWMLWEWSSPQRIQSLVIHHGQTTGRFLTGGTLQIWNGSTYVNVHTFSGLNQANCVNTVTLPIPVTSTRLRLTGFVPGTGQNSNLNFREIEVISAPPTLNDAGVVSIDSPAVFGAGLQNIAVTVRNFGINQITGVTVNWEVNGVPQSPVTYPGTLDTIGGSGSVTASVSLGQFSFTNNQLYQVRAWTSAPNFAIDTLNSNDTASRFYRSPLNGSYTIGKQNCDFISLTQASSILTVAGVSGPVTLNLADTLYSSSTGEVFPIVLTNSFGMNAINTVRIKPLAGVFARIEASVSNPAILLSNAKNFIMDGRDTFSSTGRSLSISNIGTNALSTCITLQNDAISNQIRNCEFRYNSPLTTVGALSIMGSNLLNGNDSNHILNNLFIRTSLGPYAVGVLSQGQSNLVQNDNNTIEGNEFNGFTFNGIQINGTNSGNGPNWQIINNSFFDSSTLTLQTSVWCAINFIPGTISGSTNNLISGNFIGGTMPQLGAAPLTNGTAATRVGIQLTTSLGAPTRVVGNRIGNLFLTNTTSTAAFTGIQVSAGASIVDSNTISGIVSHNNAVTSGVNVTAAANYDITRNQVFGIRLINSGTTGAIRGIVVSSGLQVNILNNSIRGLRLNSSNTGTSTASSLIGISCQSTSNSIRISGNQIGSLAEPLVQAHNSTSNVTVVGILSSSGIASIDNNIIDGLILDSTAQTTLSTSTGAAINGILCFSSSAGQIIRRNQVMHLIQRSVAASQSSQINGICYASSGFTTIDSNVVYGFSSRSSNGSTSTSAALNGINFASSGRALVVANYIDSLVLTPSTPTTGQVNGVLVIGNVGNRIAANTIKTLVNSFTTSNPGICGIQFTSSLINQECEANRIFGLINRNATSTGSITGIRYIGSNQIQDNNSLVSRNFVHSFSSNHTGTAAWNGIDISSGLLTVSNNIVRLGVDTLGQLNVNSTTINGIADNVISTTTMNRFYHNTVYIGGAPNSGVAQTAAFRAILASSQLQDIRNNIFVNVVANSGATGVNTAIALATTPFVHSIINNNLLWAGSGLSNNFIGTGPGNASFMNGLSGWRRISLTEANGIHANPGLINPSGNATTLNLQPGSTSLAEGTGDPSVLPFVPIDFAGNSRASNTPTDIGAWSSSSNTMQTDSVGPVIQFSPLTNTSLLTSRQFFATIIDRHTGLLGAALAPRVYFNKNNGPWFSTTGVLQSGDFRNGTWLFTIDSAQVGGFAIGNTINYYIIAQDSNGNYSSLPMFAIASNTGAISSHPIAPFSYQIAAPIPLTVTVGPNGMYPNLTGTAGLFNAINNSFLQGSTTVLLQGGTTISETGVVALNQWLELNGSSLGTHNYSLVIRPNVGGQVVLSGNVATQDGMIRINGADRVVFLGYDTLGSVTDTNLIVRNSAASQPALSLLNDATNCRFESVIFEGRNTGTAAINGGVVRISPSSTTTGNDNHAFRSCHFRRDITNSTLPGTPSILFAASGTSGVGRDNDDLLIENCQFYNFNLSAISIGSGTGNNQVIKSNQFYQNEGFIHTNSPVVINFLPGVTSNNDTIAGNVLGGNLAGLAGNWLITNTATSLSFTGINVSSGAVSGTVISNNRIANILHNQPLASTLTGIQVNNGGGVCRIEGNYLGDTLVSDNILHSGSSQLVAINCQTGSNAIIKNNLIANLTNNSANTTGAAINGIRSWNQTALLEISGNRIVNLKDSSANTSSSTGAAMVGINISSNSSNIMVEGNTINGLVNNSPTAISSSQVLGILSTTGLNTVRNNTVENLISRNLSTGTNTLATLIGIAITSGTPNQIITGNTVRGLTYFNPVASSSQVLGILQSSGSGHIITNNLVHNLRSNSISSGTTTSSAIVGIMHSGSGSSINLSRNHVHTLEGVGTGSNSVVGILYQGTTTLASNQVARNLVHSFKLSGTLGGRMIGIQQNSGSFTRFSNNMIRLGIDSSGVAFTGPYEVYGLLTDVSGNFEYFHNSVYIGGAPAIGSSITAAIRLNGIPTGTQVYDIRNNILVNAASNNASSAAKHYALRLAGLPTNAAGIVSNYNLFHTTGSGALLAGTNSLDYPTLFGLTGWKRGTLYDLQSGSADPHFVSASGSAFAVDLRLQSSNPAESGGDLSLAAIVTEDFDGNCRSCSTAVDIGAHAGNFTLSTDSLAPSITFMPITNQGSTVGPVLLSGVNIRDNVGVPSRFSPNAPKLYYKKGVNGTYFFTPPVSQTGTVKDATFGFEINYGFIGGVNAGDTIYYFVMAEDSLGANLSSTRPFAIASNVTTLLNEPISPDYYVILPVIPANSRFYVGNGQSFPTLTGVGGLFEFLNSNTIGGNITALITSSINEPGTFALNQIGTDGSSVGYTITIRPDSSATNARVLSGVSLNGLIRLDGADRIRFTGVPDQSSNTGLRNLLVRNSGNGPVFLFVNGAQENTLRNLIIEGSNNTAFNAVNSGLISFGGSTNGTGNSQDSLVNCIVRNDLSQNFPAGVPGLLVSSVHTGLTLNSSNVLINNQFSNASVVYINVEAGSGDNWNVSNNSLFMNLPIITSNPVAIRFNGGLLSGAHTISNNFIGGSTLNAGGASWVSNVQANWNQIQLAIGGNAPTLVSGNTIRNMRFSQTVSANQWNGIIVTSGRVNILNNMLGDSTQAGSLQLNPPTNHNGISITGTVTSSIQISGNRIAGVSLNNPGANTQFIGVFVSGGICSISSNNIGAASQSNSIVHNSNSVVRGILVSTPANLDPATQIMHNSIANITCLGNQSAVSLGGILVNGTTAANISNNRIFNLSSQSSNIINSAASLNVFGIGVGANTLPGVQINNNTIFNIESSNQSGIVSLSAGIIVQGANNLKLASNRIYAITNLSTSGSINPMATASGIQINSISNLAEVSNNQIVLGVNQTNGVQYNGIWQNGTGSFDVNYFNNSVVVTGTSTNAIPTYAFHRGNNSTIETVSGVRLINNAFINNRSGANSKGYAIANEVSGTVSGSAWLESNYNYLSSSNTSTIGLWGGSDRSISSWILSSNTDRNSWSELSSIVNPNSLFTDINNGNLNVAIASPLSWYLNGKGIAGNGIGNLATDFNGNTRGITYGFGVDIGSHEFTTSTLPPLVQVTGAPQLGASSVLRFAGRTLATLNWANAGTAPISLEARYYSGQNPPATFSGSKFMNAYLDVQLTGGSSYAYTLTMNYEPALIGSVANESSLRVASYVANTWNHDVSSVVNTSSKTLVGTSQLNGSAVFTGTDFNSPLPVDLVLFEGQANGEDALLRWKTASEINNKGFAIERSWDGLNYSQIDFVKGAGNSSSSRTYDYVDKAALSKRTYAYYRLIQIDLDGSSTTSEPVLVMNEKMNESGIKVYPNPFEERLIIELMAEEGIASLLVQDMNGAEVLGKIVKTSEGFNRIELTEMNQMPTGIYFLKVLHGGRVEIQKLVHIAN